jgi:hypothetical protein
MGLLRVGKKGETGEYRIDAWSWRARVQYLKDGFGA